MEQIRIAFEEAIIKKVNVKDCKRCLMFAVKKGKPTCGYDPHIDSDQDKCILIQKELY